MVHKCFFENAFIPFESSCKRTVYYLIFIYHEITYKYECGRYLVWIFVKLKYSHSKCAPLHACRLWPMWGAVRTSNTPNQTRIWHWPETIFIHSRLWIEHVMGLCCTCLVRTLDVGGKKPIVLRSTQWDTLSCEIITTYIWFANRSLARSLGERQTCAIH